MPINITGQFVPSGGAGSFDLLSIDDVAPATADITTGNASTSFHGFLLKATAPAATYRNVVAIDNAETVYKNAVLFDATTPADLTGTAATGSAMTAARRDHVHVGLSSAQLTDLTDTNATTLHKHDHGGQDGLSDDDHTQYIKDSEFTADSEILVGTGSGTFQKESGATLRTSIGIGNVENTALSTWAGTTNVTTLGTIATGAWAGTEIPINKGGTGATTAQAAIDALTAVAAATAEHVLTKDTATGNAIFKVASGGGGAPHAILDGSTHSDSVADAVTRGSLIYGNSTPKWDELVVGAANSVLFSDGTDAAWSTGPTLAALTFAGTAEYINFAGATGQNLIRIPDNLDVALGISEGANSYMRLCTTNGSELVIFDKSLVSLGTLGIPTSYVGTSYQTLINMNATASLSGATAGQINLAGNMDISGSLAIGSTATVSALRSINMLSTYTDYQNNKQHLYVAPTFSPSDAHTASKELVAIGGYNIIESSTNWANSVEIFGLQFGGAYFGATAGGAGLTVYGERVFGVGCWCYSASTFTALNSFASYLIPTKDWHDPANAIMTITNVFGQYIEAPAHGTNRYQKVLAGSGDYTGVWFSSGATTTPRIWASSATRGELGFSNVPVISYSSAALGFFNTTPIAKKAHIADATDAATAITRINLILVALESYGLLATS